MATKLGAFNWSGAATLEVVGNTPFVAAVEEGKTKWCYSAEIHLRTIAAVVAATEVTSRARGNASGVGAAHGVGGVIVGVVGTATGSGISLVQVGEPGGFELREDGGFELREDGSRQLRE